MKSFIKTALDSGYTCLGLYNGKLKFVKTFTIDKEEDVKDNENMSVYEVDKDECEFAEDKLVESTLKCADEEDDDEDDEEKKELQAKIDTLSIEKEELANAKEELSVEKEELSAKVDTLSAEKEDYKSKFEKSEDELKEFKQAQFKAETDVFLNSEDGIDEDIKKELMSLRDSGAFSTKEDFVKELSYKQYLKNAENRQSSKTLIFNLNPKAEKKETKETTLLDKLSKI